MKIVYIFYFHDSFFFLGSVKGLAYLASRRSSARDGSSKGGSSVEDLGPLNFQASARLRNRRTSNFLELPG